MAMKHFDLVLKRYWKSMESGLRKCVGTLWRIRCGSLISTSPWCRADPKAFIWKAQIKKMPFVLWFCCTPEALRCSAQGFMPGGTFLKREQKCQHPDNCAPANSFISNRKKWNDFCLKKIWRSQWSQPCNVNEKRCAHHSCLRSWHYRDFSQKSYFSAHSDEQ